MLYIKEEEVRGLLSMDAAVRAVEEAFRGLGTGSAVNIPRSRVRLPGHTLHVMSGGIPELNLTGLKAYTTTRHGARFLVLLFKADTGEPLAAIEADRLGQMRTGAASGVATKYMARDDAATVGVIGTGWQARSQLAAVCEVRKVTGVKAYGRDRTRREAYCSEMSEALGVPVRPVDSARACVEEVDVVITITSAARPVLEGAWLSPGAHVNAAGSNALVRSEIDAETVRRASVVTVDSREQARVECGDLLESVEKGHLQWDRIHELADVVAGHVPGRTDSDDITLFESQGLAVEDVAVAAVVYERAKAEGAGDPGCRAD
ncbi:MAG: ornithine cyclodeaminase family protein [Gemmatimonadetes bacterium]|nr:ornithine cyclodeaminase family protein [Gemmatimonadota bacterium]